MERTRNPLSYRPLSNAGEVSCETFIWGSVYAAVISKRYANTTGIRNVHDEASDAADAALEIYRERLT